MEIFTEMGFAERVYEQSTPADKMKATGWYAGVAGDHPRTAARLGHLGRLGRSWVWDTPVRPI